MKRRFPEEICQILRSLSWLSALALTASAQMGGGPPSPLNKVAKLRFEVPQTPYAAAPEMVVRGTFPLPPGTYFEGDPVPFKLVDPFGVAVSPTQVEIVSRYPDTANDGVDVVEVLARIERDPSWGAGDIAVLDVIAGAGGEQPDPGTADLTDLVSGPEIVTSDVQALLSVPQGIAIVGHGPQGEVYVCYPLDGTGAIRNDRYGPVQSGVRVYQGLAIESYQEGDLRTLAGVHAYLETVSEENALRLNLRFNNGNDNLQEALGDDLRGEVFFDDLSLYLVDDGRDWTARQEFVDPHGIRPTTVPTTGTLAGSPHTYRVFPLVAPLTENKSHVIFCRDQFHRRLVIAPEEEFTAASQAPQRLLHHVGQAFSKWGNDTYGQPLWSWWNPETARYFPQRQMLAKMNFSNGNYGGSSAMRVKLGNWYSGLRSSLEENTPIGGFLTGSASQLGWARPLYDPYKGAASGNGIQIVDGDRSAAVASTNGYRFLLLRHRLITERMRNILYSLDGDPTSYDDFVASHPTTGEPYFELPAGFQMDFGDGDTVFCPLDVPLWNQNDYVQSNSLQPPYYATLQNYQPIDKQHGCRYDTISTAIAWLGNDPLAKDDLIAQAELYRMTFSEHPNINGSSQGWSLSGAQSKVLPCLGGIPGWGFDCGRANAWGLQTMSAAFALQDDAWRSQVGTWFEKVAGLFHTGLGLTTDANFLDGTGTPYPWAFVGAKVNNKLYGSSAPVRARQTWEDMLISIALRGMQRSVFADSSAEHNDLAEAADALQYGFLAPLNWDQNGLRVWDIGPVTPNPYPDSPVIYNCDPIGGGCIGQNQYPAGYAPKSEVGVGNAKHYTFAPFGDALGATGDMLFLQAAHQALTGSSCSSCATQLKDALEELDPNADYSAWSNKVHLLGLLQ